MAKAPAGRAKLEKISRETFVTLATNVKGTPATAKWAMHLLEELEKGRTFRADTMGALAAETGVPRKFLSRAISFLDRYGRATFRKGPPTLLAPRGNQPRGKTKRAAPSRADRAHIYALDGGRCGQCDAALAQEDLAVDHIIPLSFLGADQPGNWVSLCQPCNKEKSDGFHSRHLKRFRGKPVEGAVGVRFVDGAFWPHINGRVQKATRSTWRP